MYFIYYIFYFFLPTSTSVDGAIALLVLHIHFVDAFSLPDLRSVFGLPNYPLLGRDIHGRSRCHVTWALCLYTLLYDISSFIFILYHECFAHFDVIHIHFVHTINIIY